MKKFLLAIMFLLIPSLANSSPSNTMTVTPTATDDTVIEAVDENTRNTNISTPYNAHTHNGLIAENALIVGSTNAEFSTIQTALNSVTSGDTILVHEGTYTEALTGFADNVTLRAVGTACV